MPKIKTFQNDMKDCKIRRVILFTHGLVGVGGAERLLLEEERHFSKNGLEVFILVFNFRKEALFNNTYKPNVQVLLSNNRRFTNNILVRIMCHIYGTLKLRSKIGKLHPDVIIGQNFGDCLYLYLGTLFTRFSYVTHIHGTPFWFSSFSKYALIHKKVFNEIRNSVIGHKEFISPMPPKIDLLNRILLELFATVEYIGVRKSKKIFVLSNQMKWEVKKLYRKDGIVLKGAFPARIFDYKPRKNIKEKLGLQNRKIILNINRLDPRKRVDLVIKSLGKICKEFDDVTLIIGGAGSEERTLRKLVQKLSLSERVKFVGYINDRDLWDYYSSCDVFVHPNWADFAIAPYETLALQKKVVWSSEMETDTDLLSNKHLFTAEPTVSEFTKVIKRALITEIKEKNDLSDYTWDKYFSKILVAIRNCKNENSCTTN